MLCGAAASPAVLLHPDAVERDGLHLHARLLCLPRHLDRQACIHRHFLWMYLQNHRNFPEYICTRTCGMQCGNFPEYIWGIAEISKNRLVALRKFPWKYFQQRGNFPKICLRNRGNFPEFLLVTMRKFPWIDLRHRSNFLDFFLNHQRHFPENTLVTSDISLNILEAPPTFPWIYLRQYRHFP